MSRSGELTGIIAARTACQVKPAPSTANATIVVRNPSVTWGVYGRGSRLNESPRRWSHVVEGIDAVLRRFDRRHNRIVVPLVRAFPEVAIVRQVQHRSVFRDQHSHS